MVSGYFRSYLLCFGYWLERVLFFLFFLNLRDILEMLFFKIKVNKIIFFKINCFKIWFVNML